MPMTNETFCFIWRSFGNQELFDSEASSSSEENYTTNSSVEKPAKPQRRKQDVGYYNRKSTNENYFQTYYQKKTKQNCVCDICGFDISCKSNLAKHKKTIENQTVPQVLVQYHDDFMIQTNIIKLKYN
jgi:hypothetical protein